MKNFRIARSHISWMFAITLGLFTISAPVSKAYQLEWSSEVFSSIVDSNGNVLDAANFVFDLGSFNDDFTPSESNVESWIANWNVFDTATYNEDAGFFTSDIEPYDGRETVFEDLGISRTAYIWIRNADTPVPGTEWLIVRASDWFFPDLFSGCCDNDETIQWSISDLTSSDIPLWGNQLGIEGPGERSVYDTGADLQTYTFIPEPSSALLIAIAGMLGALRRSRQPQAA